MIQLHENSIYLVDGRPEEKASIPQNEARKQTMAWQILQAHNTSGDPERLKIRFDAMVSHDITYVGIIQQARASGMKEFPIPYALTNCHNSLCARTTMSSACPPRRSMAASMCPPTRASSIPMPVKSSRAAAR